MNWERLFYWLTIADDIHAVLLIITTLLGTGLLALCLLAISSYMSDRQHFKILRKYTLLSTTLFVIIGIATLLTPDDDDLMLMISGTAVGTVFDTTFVYEDLPDEVADLLRLQLIEKLKNTKKKTRDYLDLLTIEDTLKYVPRSELYDIITTLSKPYGIEPKFSD